MRMMAQEIDAQIDKSSWIRRMFDLGAELKQRVGAGKVQDFSLGNPDVPPPDETAAVLRRIADRVHRPLALGYVPNAGMPSLRARLAERLSREQTCALTADNVLITCGAAGGLCTFFRAVLEPGDEVLCPAPYFVEYGFYAGHFGGVLRPVPMPPKAFDLDVEAMAAAITPRTRAVLINAPNNPTGAVYDQASLTALAAVIEDVNATRDRPLYLVSDEPYRSLVYDGVDVPPILPLSPFALIIGSFSKSLSLAGERIGYMAVRSDIPDFQRVMGALTMTNRTLGYVNAPVIGQILVDALLETVPDVAVYDRRRHAMASVLDGAGIEYCLPRGAFYFFPEAPGGDDQAFVDRLLQQHILAVPGRGFGRPGFFRLSFAVDESVILAAAEGFRRAVAETR